MSNRLGWDATDFRASFPSNNPLISILDPPRDNGGAEIKQYQLELEESKGN